MSGISGVTNQEQEVDIKPNIQSTHINVKIKAQDGMEVAFSIRKTAPLKKLMNAYCDHRSVTLDSVVFLTAEGKRFFKEQTPNEVGMEDGDVLDAMLPQMGGGMTSY